MGKWSTFLCVSYFVLEGRQMRYLNICGEVQEFKTVFKFSIGLSLQTCLYNTSTTSGNLATNYYANPFQILFLRLDFG